MKNFLKTKWQIVVIILLFLFGMNKCTQSCNRQGEIDRLNYEYNKLDSIHQAYIKIMEDSLNGQNSQLNILEERVSGLKNMNEAVNSERNKTDEANRRANAASQRERELRKQLKNK